MRRPDLAPHAGLALCVVLAGCVPSLHHLEPRDPKLDLPASYAATDAAVGPGADPAAAGTWRDLFQDPELVASIDEALANNQELAILQQEIFTADAEVMARKGEYLPRAGIFAGAGAEKVGEFTSQGASDAAHEVAPGVAFPVPLGDLHFGLGASWEVDVWKKLRNSAKAARLRYLATVEGRSFAVTLLVAELARSWYELLALDNQLVVLRSNIALLEDSIEVIGLQKQAGRVTELGVQRFEAELLGNRSREFEVRQQIVETENRINFLRGRYPQPIARQSAQFLALNPAAVQVGLPTRLLENRPDVREAELRLEAADLDVKVARAAFYPSLSIDAELGYEAFAADHLLTTPESLLYGVAADLFAPLLNRKGLKADYLAANSKEMAAVVSYERTVLNGYVEASNQLAAVENLGQSYARKQEQVARLQQATETSSLLFQSARADWLEVLTTRREALDSQLELLETKQRQLGAAVDLYQALGGGWQAPDEVTE